MTPSKKIFLAATLVAAGYGIAALLGAPDPRLWPDNWANVGPSPNRPVTAALQSADNLSGSAKVGSVRLLPEPSAASERLRSAETTASATSTLSSPPVLAVSPESETSKPAPSPSMPLLTSRPLPRATLKNEAPRPLPMADRPATPIATGRLDATVYTPPIATLQINANSQVVSAGFASVPSVTAPTSQAPCTRNETQLRPIEAARPAGPVSPPPWPIAEEEPLRSHVIVDGDSLAKLAGRYLDDPRRSEEIFALNRGVLSDPELLPIGAELKIPPRGAGNPILQSRTIGASSVHAAERTGLVPVRLPPPAPALPPRAQLLPPKPVE